MNTSKSKVMTIANKLVAQGYNRAHAMIKAWALVKLPAVATKVAGVTFGNRQTAIAHLTQYAPESITIRLQREQGNQYDRNAVAVIAAVEGKGSYHMGYLPKALAAFIAPLMDAGKAVQGIFKEVRGGYEPYMNLGLVVEVIA
jgi:hypothetical protein